VLSKDPPDIRVRGFLHRVVPIRVGLDREERVVGQTVQQRGLLDDLVDRVLDGRRSRVGDRVEVHRDDGDPVRELLDVLSGRAAGIHMSISIVPSPQTSRTSEHDSLETVKVVQIRQGRKELLGPAHLVTDDDPPLPTLLDLEQLDHGPTPLPDLVHNMLIDLERLVRGLFQERPVRDGLDVDRLVRVERRRVAFGEDASLQEVASELLTRSRGDGPGRSVGLESVSLVDGRVIQVVFVDPTEGAPRGY
jgi:hypothetical protein